MTSVSGEHAAQRALPVLRQVKCTDFSARRSLTRSRLSRTLGAADAPSSTRAHLHALQPTAEAARIALGVRGVRTNRRRRRRQGYTARSARRRASAASRPSRTAPTSWPGPAPQPTHSPPASRLGQRISLQPASPANCIATTRPHPTAALKPQKLRRGVCVCGGVVDATRSGGGGVGSYTRVRIEADRAACPVLLSNGNLIAKARPAPFAPT
jgi:hypothetical protein